MSTKWQKNQTVAISGNEMRTMNMLKTETSWDDTHVYKVWSIVQVFYPLSRDIKLCINSFRHYQIVIPLSSKPSKKERVTYYLNLLMCWCCFLFSHLPVEYYLVPSRCHLVLCVVWLLYHWCIPNIYFFNTIFLCRVPIGFIPKFKNTTNFKQPKSVYNKENASRKPFLDQNG